MCGANLRPLLYSGCGLGKIEGSCDLYVTSIDKKVSCNFKTTFYPHKETVRSRKFLWKPKPTTHI